MKIKILLLMIAFAFSYQGVSTFAQMVSSSATWALSDSTGGKLGTGTTVATTGLITAPRQRLNKMVLNGYSGPSSSQRAQTATKNWPANRTAQFDTVYLEYAVTPQPTSVFHVSTISLNIGCSGGISTMKANIYYALEPSFANAKMINYSTGIDYTPAAGTPTSTNVLSGTAPLTQVNAIIDESLNPGTTLYVRVYPWVDQDATVGGRTGKYLCVQNVVISGQCEPLPVLANVVWGYNPTPVLVNTGPILGQSGTYSPAMKYYGKTSLPIFGSATNLMVGSVYPVVNSWTASPDIDETLYFQYSCSPKTGGTLTVKTVSMYLGGWFSANLKATVFYSKDPSFTDRTLLISDIQLVGNAVMPLTADLATAVNSGETFYLRIYPHNLATEGSYKLVAVDSVRISGVVTGATSDPPIVTGLKTSYISVTSASSGGSVSSDGGAAVTAKGVCWNTDALPTIDNNKTVDGTGSGAFVSHVKGLTSNTTYHLRAYATNSAGTSYGGDSVFTTLADIVPPTVTKVSASGILVIQATAGGNATAWGGDTIKTKGICWNTTGKPTIDDSKTVNGSDLGSFTSILYPLVANTKYYFRAYATNSAGTGYSIQDSLTTQLPAADVIKIVAKDGSGDYSTVQAAFTDVPDNYTGKYTIFVKPGIYKEKLLLGKNKINVTLKSIHPDSTILTYDDYSDTSNGTGGTVGTSGSYSVAIDANDFTAMNLTFANTVKNDGTKANQQAVALRTNGDRQSYFNCKITGYQDTYYAWGGSYATRIYMKNSYISGSVDFIFGNEIVVFDSCEIHINRNSGSLTAASTDATSAFGLVFRNCNITADAIGFNATPITTFYLGRPWQNAPRTVFLNCSEPSSLAPAAWQTWNVTPALYAEYKCTGSGSATSGRLTSISRQLTDNESTTFTVANIFAKTSNAQFAYDWMPDQTIYKFSQTLTLDDLPAVTYKDTLVVASPVATSKLPGVLVSSDVNLATTSNDSISVKSAGNVYITATQPGNFLYNAAPEVVKVLDIAKVNLQITSDDAAKTYGEINPPFSATYEGFVRKENLTNLSTPAIISSTASTTAAVGTYPITISGAASSNYAITYVETGLFTINKAMLTVSAMDATRMKGLANPVFSLAYSGFAGSDNNTDLDTQPFAACTATLESPVGSYDIAVEGGVDNNYDFTYKIGVLAVTVNTGFNELSEKDILFYPNPVGSVLRIQNIPPLSVIGIYNVNGILVSSVKSSKTLTEIDMTGFESGIYIIKISATNNFIIKQVVKI